MKLSTTLSILLSLAFFSQSLVYAQNVQQRKKIADSYNRVLLKNQSIWIKNKIDSLKNAAFAHARLHQLDTLLVFPDGREAHLQSIEEDGTLNYVTTYSSGSAITSNVNELYHGGSLQLNLSGKDIVVGVWDDGRARPTHQEYDTRLTHIDDADDAPKTHTTHVTGIVMSSGDFNPSAKGMAYQSFVEGYDFFDDIPEIQSAAANGLLVSNHSYGLSPSQLDEWVFGAYIQLSRFMDLIMNESPYYMPVFAVGNSRNNNPPNNPTKDGFDLVTGRSVSKNSLSVANVLQVNNYTGPSSVQLNSRSSFGPTDDLRIKPELSAKGTNVLSTYPHADDAYGNITGTSMAAPVAVGTIALLQELNFNLHEAYLKSHEIRALLCGTTLPTGNGPEPDVKFGFGLLNAEKAADVVLNNGFTSYFDEIHFVENEAYTKTVTPLDSSIPIEVTIAWNDPAADLQPAGIVDFDAPRLVNDLDLRIFDENGNEFEPSYIQTFEFDHETATGDNAVDNIEKIHIPNPSGDYTIEVTHKGSLKDGEQDFAIVVTGVAESSFNVLLTENEKEICPDEDLIYTLTYAQIPAFEDVVSFTASGLPDEVTASFSPSTASEDTAVELTLSNLSTLTSGDYDFQIQADGPSHSILLEAKFTLLEAIDFEAIHLNFPANQQTDVLLNPLYFWNAVEGAQEYLVEVSTDPDFNAVLFSQFADQNSISFGELEAETLYYWRVAAINDCLQGDFQVGEFSTEVISCNNVVEAEDLPIEIDEGEAGVYESSLFISTPIVDQISKLSVSIDISHSWLEDLIVSLISPSGVEVILLEQECGDGADIQATFDDVGLPLVCNQLTPTINGTIQPQDMLSAFVGEEVVGEWVLRVEDVSAQEGGSINSFSIDFCDGTATLSAEEFSANPISIFPNPASESVQLSLDKTSFSNLSVGIHDVSGKLIQRNKFRAQQSTYQIDTSQLSPGMYLLVIDLDGKTQTEKLIIQ